MTMTAEGYLKSLWIKIQDRNESKVQSQVYYKDHVYI